MKITLELPERTKCLNVCVVYDGTPYPTMQMAAMMRGTDELRDGAYFRIPAGSEEKGEDDCGF